MLKRLTLLALAFAGGWIAYRRLFAPPSAPAMSPATRLPSDAPPPGLRPWPAADAPAAAEVADQLRPDANTAKLAAAQPPAPETPAPPASPEAAEQLAPHDAAPEAYCVRCKAHRAIVDLHIETTPSGRRAAKGTCPVCGSKLNRFLPSIDE